MPEVLIGLLRAFWATQAGQFTFGAAASYSVWAGTASSQGTQGGILDTIWSNIKDAARTVVAIQSGTFFSAHKAVRSTVSHWALAQEKAQAAWYTHLNLLVRETYSSNLATANAAADAIERLRFHVIPREISAATLPIAKTARQAQADAKTALAREHALSESFTTSHRAQVKLNVHYTHAIDVTLPRRIGQINTREDALSRDQAKLKERTTSLENGAIKTFEWIASHPLSAATSVFAGAVAIALQRIGWGVLRCRSWQKLGRSLTCGMGAWLSDLLGLIATFALATFAVLDPEALAEAAVAAVDTVEPLLAEILSK